MTLRLQNCDSFIDDDIEIVNNQAGAPSVKVRKAGFGDLHIELSPSHCEGQAVAFAVVIDLKSSAGKTATKVNATRA